MPKDGLKSSLSIGQILEKEMAIKKSPREMIQDVLVAAGWTFDRWGHLNKVLDAFLR